MLLPSILAWLRTDGQKMEAALRRVLLDLHRTPAWLPCWFHGLWHRAVAGFRKVSVIIGVEGDCTALHQAIKRHRATAHHLEETGHICTRVPAGALKDLCGCPGVRRIWQDGEVRALLDDALPSANAVEAASKYTGRGITIAVADTGIYPHRDLAGRIVAFRDFVGRRTAPYDDNGHGTHVAGCAAGNGLQSGGRYRGPAPEARLVGVKVLDRNGSGRMSALLAGINWVIQNKSTHGTRILSLSLGGPAQGACADDPLCQAVTRAWHAGIVVVVAAGNEGPGQGTISTPGINPFAITVGAMNDKGTPNRRDDTLASFSSRGPTPEGQHKPDLVAPGFNITSLRSPNSQLDKANPEARVGSWYFTLSGTSMATPLVAGIVALMLQARPDLTPSMVKFRLKATAQDRGLPPDNQGSGYVDADRAVLT